MEVELARQYAQYKREQGLPPDQDNCLYFIHFLLEQKQPANGVMWVTTEASNGLQLHAFQVIDKNSFARRYGLLSDGKSIPKYDSIRRLLNNYAFHCDKKIIWYCSQLDDDGMRLFRPKMGSLLLKIKKKGYRSPNVGMYPDDDYWSEQSSTSNYSNPNGSFNNLINNSPSFSSFSSSGNNPQNNNALLNRSSSSNGSFNGNSNSLMGNVNNSNSNNGNNNDSMINSSGNNVFFRERDFNGLTLPPAKRRKHHDDDVDAAGILSDLGKASSMEDASDEDSQGMDIDSGLSKNSLFSTRSSSASTANNIIRPLPIQQNTFARSSLNADQISLAAASMNGLAHPSTLALLNASVEPRNNNAYGAPNAHTAAAVAQFDMYNKLGGYPAYGLPNAPLGRFSPFFDPTAIPSGDLPLLPQHAYQLPHLYMAGNPHFLGQQPSTASLNPFLSPTRILSGLPKLATASERAAVEALMETSKEKKDDGLFGSIKKEDSDLNGSDGSNSSKRGSDSDDALANSRLGRLARRSALAEEVTPMIPESLGCKRNKFFYKELRDHLDASKPKLPIGFVNDVFFLMDPKLHVGPINRDGTYEKRVRLHFIEWLELKHNNFQLWLCWGTLLDQFKAPLFRHSGLYYKIPGNQSANFKANKTYNGWTVAEGPAKANFRRLATIIKNELDDHWDGNVIEGARALIAALNLALPNSPPLDESGTPMSAPRPSPLFELSPSSTTGTPASDALEALRSISSSPKPAMSPNSVSSQSSSLSIDPNDSTSLPSANAAAESGIQGLNGGITPSSSASPSSALTAKMSESSSSIDNVNYGINNLNSFDASTAAMAIWKQCPLLSSFAEIHNQRWRDTHITLTPHMERQLMSAFGITAMVDESIKMFKLFATTQGKLSFSDLELTIKRFGTGRTMFKKMLNLLETKAFNGNMGADLTRQVLSNSSLPDGTFLIRYSQSFPENFVFCWKVGEMVEQVNKIANCADAGLEMYLPDAVAKLTSWAQLIDSSPALTQPLIHSQFQQFEHHGIPLASLKESLSSLQDSLPSTAVDHKPSSLPSPMDTNSDSSALIKLQQQAAADADFSNMRNQLLEFFAQLFQENRISNELWTTWSLHIASPSRKDTVAQLHTLFNSFKTKPDFFLPLANKILSEIEV